MRRVDPLSAVACSALPVMLVMLSPGIRTALIAERAHSAVQLGSLPGKCELPPPSRPREVVIRFAAGGGFEAADEVTRMRVCRSVAGRPVETADSRLFGPATLLEYTVKGSRGVTVLQLAPGWAVATREDRA